MMTTSSLGSSASKAAETPSAAATPVNEGSFFKRYGLLLAIAVLALVCWAPQPEGLSVTGQRMIGIMLFAVIVWSTTAMSYPVSAGVIMALIAILVGLAPKPDAAGLFGTGAAMRMALAGFSSPAFCLVGAALFLSAAMVQTGLDKRIALNILSRIGTDPKHIVLGVILCGFILSFFVPSTTARVACLVPIVVGIVHAFGLSMNSSFAGLLMITVAQIDSVWNIGIKTAAAQNMVAVNFIREMTGVEISWLEWFIAAAPLAGLLSVALYLIVAYLMRNSVGNLKDGKAAVTAQLKAMGPISANEIKLTVISVLLLLCWVTEKKLHPIDTTTATVCAIALLMLPGIGVMNWKGTVERINWGTILLFGVGISLGSGLLATKAAQWLANGIVANFGLANAEIFFVLAVMAAFLIVIHLGFASATGLASAIIPIVIAVFSQLEGPNVNVVGLTMIMQYVVSFGYILPVNAPQNMIAYSTGSFSVRTFAIIGVVFTLIAYAMVLLLSATYWSWLGLT